MIRITQLKLSINHTPEELAHKIRKALRLKNEGFSYEIVKQSLDCRHKDDKKIRIHCGRFFAGKKSGRQDCPKSSR